MSVLVRNTNYSLTLTYLMWINTGQLKTIKTTTTSNADYNVVHACAETAITSVATCL